jgi:hypothetical protein
MSAQAAALRVEVGKFKLESDDKADLKVNQFN